MDIKTYDRIEELARQSVDSWSILEEFTPYLLAIGGFPIRIGGIHELHSIYANNQNIFKDIESELAGLNEEDIEVFISGLVRYISFYKKTMNSSDVPIADSTLLHHCSTYLRLKTLSKQSRILEIGPGIGAVPLFFDDDFNPRAYDQIEVTQSMYISQSLIGRHRFGHRFNELAMELPRITRTGTRGLSAIEGSKHRPASNFAVTVEPCSTHFPWWRLDDAFENTYDVVVANHCLAEMKPGIMSYYIQQIDRCLDDNGFLLIQGLGSQRGMVKKDMVLNTLTENGFRPLVHAPAKRTTLSAFSDNILAVTSRHELTDQCAADFSEPFIARHSDIVAGMYRLTRPAQRRVNRDDILNTAVERARRSLNDSLIA